MKQDIATIAEKNRRIRNVTEAVIEGSEFLVMGHKNPDDDCLGSMVAIGLLIQRFSKNVSVYTTENVGEKLGYLLDICRYNSIDINYGIPWERVDTVIVCDTAKPELLETGDESDRLLADSSVRTIEIDHHLSTDSQYIGDEGYRLVMEASSSAEIIGYFAYKLSKRTDLLAEYEIEDMFPRNFVLSVITGLVGDTNLGQFLPTARVARSYHFFSNYFNRILRRKTVRLRNYSSQEELFQELGTLSSRERACFDQLLDKAEFSGGIGYRGVSRQEIVERFSRFGVDTIANTSRAAADSLAEAAGKVGIVAYWDPDADSSFVRCSARRGHGYREFDLRDLIAIGGIQNGGGHPGAVGFRIPKNEVEDVEEYLQSLVARLAESLP